MYRQKRFIRRNPTKETVDNHEEQQKNPSKHRRNTARGGTGTRNEQGAAQPGAKKGGDQLCGEDDQLMRQNPGKNKPQGSQ